MSTDPTYNPKPLSMGQIAKALAPLTQAKLGAPAAKVTAGTAGTFTDRAGSLFNVAPQAPAPTPVAPPPKTFSSITSAVTTAVPNTMVRSLGGKTFSK